MSIESVLHENRIFEPSEAFKKQATVSGMEAYNKLCAEAAADYEGFWAKLARELLVWHKPSTTANKTKQSIRKKEKKPLNVKTDKKQNVTRKTKNVKVSYCDGYFL